MKYYDISEDIQKHPDAWLYIIVGGRHTGKTYSTLKNCLDNQRDFIFIKRTMDDVDMMSALTGKVKSKVADLGADDLNPFSAINRDTGSDIQTFSIRTGIAGFWNTTRDEEGNLVPVGSPLGMAFALNGVTKYKGMELASSGQEQWIIFDEFIPNIYDRVNRKEGIQLLDFYETVSRDRPFRGLQEVKLICLANATSIANPVFDALELVDDVARMQSLGEHELFNQERGIYIHQLEDNQEMLNVMKNTGIYRAMNDTAWGRMSFGNEFAYNDFSNVSKKALKGYRCVFGYTYRNKGVYIYYNAGVYYITDSKGNPDRIYDLSRENDQKAMYYDWVITLRDACISDSVRFKTYSMYDLLINFKKIFRIT